MRIEKVLRLRRAWAMKGNPVCDHRVVDGEYYLGKYTGNYICTTCGKSFTCEEWEQEINKKHNHLESATGSCVTRRSERLTTRVKGFINNCATFCIYLSSKGNKRIPS